MRFRNRQTAGQELAIRHTDLHSDDVLLGIPTGGCVVGMELARHNNMPLHVIVTSKIRSPRNPEVALGAVGPDGHAFVDEQATNALRVYPDDISSQIKLASADVKKRLLVYRNYIPSPSWLRGKRVHVVDDGIATGHSIMAACRYLAHSGAERIFVLTPVASPDAARELQQQATVISLLVPDDFYAVGLYYEDFKQMTDLEVLGQMGDVC